MAKIILRAGKVAIKIILLFTILGFIFYSVKVLVPAKANVESVPDELTAEFEQAEAYQEEGQYEEAEQIYWGILDRYPGTDDALAAQTQLTILYINWDKPADAEAALEQLKSDFAVHPEIPLEVCRVAEAYFDTNQPKKSKQLYEQAMNTWPNYAWYEQEGMGHILIFANSCSESGQPQKALEIYRDIFDGQKEVWHAIEVWQAIEAMQLYEGLRIALGEDPNVQTIVDKYTPRFLEEGKSVEALHDIGKLFETAGANDKAIEIYQAIIDTWTAIPENTPDRTSWMEPLEIISVLNVELGNEGRAQDVYDNLLASFYGKEDIVVNICNITEVYHRKQQYQKVIAMCEDALTGWPDSPDAILIRCAVIRANIAIRNDPNVQEAQEEFDRLVAEFSDSSALPNIIVRIGGAYYWQGRWRAMAGDTEGEAAFYQVAISVWERLIEELANPESVASAYYYSGVLYAQELGEYQKGIDYFQAALDTLSDYEFGWAAQYLIARFTEKLRDSGTIAEAEANARIKAAYEAVVEDWPDSRWVETALLKLGRMSFSEGQFADATMYFEWLLEKYPEKICLMGNDLSGAYEQMGDAGMSAQIQAELVENNCQ